MNPATMYFRLVKHFIMAWVILILAGLFEIAFTTCLSKAKLATGNKLFGQGKKMIGMVKFVFLGL